MIIPFPGIVPASIRVSLVNSRLALPGGKFTFVEPNFDRQLLLEYLEPLVNYRIQHERNSFVSHRISPSSIQGQIFV